ncbi:hypothetical protein AB6T38_07115 [Aliiglaciecola sp. SL4]|uniref:hypothetical protein n=1 Tax=Aliiglaciecola sp. SL4 TaxID=3239806 RepID=UPI00355AEF91
MFRIKFCTGLVLHTLCLVALIFQGGTLFAQTLDGSGSSLRISGFGTLGLTSTDAPDGWGFRRDIAQPSNDGGLRGDIDSRLGLQFNYAPTAQFELVGQFVLKRRSSYTPASDAIEWAFAAYRPLPDFTMRVGRVNIDAFLAADYRNVGFAYSFARPPVEFYGSLPHSLDGIDINKDMQFDDSFWRFKVYAGRSHSGDLAFDGRTTIKPIYGLTVSRESNGLTLRLGLAYAGLASNPTIIKPLLEGLDSMAAVPIPEVVSQVESFQSRLDNTDSHGIYHSFAMNYDLLDWLWTFEMTKVTGHPSTRLTAGYAGIGKRIGSVTLLAGYSRISTPKLPVSAPDWVTPLTPILGEAVAFQAQAIASASALAVNSSGANQHSISLGARWDFRHNMALKVQWDQVSVDEYGARLWANGTLESTNADVYSVLVDFVF